MKKLATVLFASVLLLAANTASANCGKKDCKDCKKETKAHKCDKKCMKDGKCAEMKKETPKAKTNSEKFVNPLKVSLKSPIVINYRAFLYV